MIRKYKSGVMVAALVLTAAVYVPGYCRIVASAQRVQQSFRELETAGTSLSTVERFVFSLVLANSDRPQPAPPARNRS